MWSTRAKLLVILPALCIAAVAITFAEYVPVAMNLDGTFPIKTDQLFEEDIRGEIYDPSESSLERGYRYYRSGRAESRKDQMFSYIYISYALGVILAITTLPGYLMFRLARDGKQKHKKYHVQVFVMAAVSVVTGMVVSLEVIPGLLLLFGKEWLSIDPAFGLGPFFAGLTLIFSWGWFSYFLSRKKNAISS
jgi:uncharacterized membrane protein